MRDRNPLIRTAVLLGVVAFFQCGCGKPPQERKDPRSSYSDSSAVPSYPELIYSISVAELWGSTVRYTITVSREQVQIGVHCEQAQPLFGLECGDIDASWLTLGFSADEELFKQFISLLRHESIPASRSDPQYADGVNWFIHIEGDQADVYSVQQSLPEADPAYQAHVFSAFIAVYDGEIQRVSAETEPSSSDAVLRMAERACPPAGWSP